MNGNVTFPFAAADARTIGQLDSLKHDYERLGDFLTTVAEELFQSSPATFSGVEVLHLPQLSVRCAYPKFCLTCLISGHLIALPVDANRDIQTHKHIDQLEFQFIAEDKLFYKNERTRQLDNEIGDIRG